ncbi:MAG TPA: flagellar basal body rod protein FlgC [Terracidiphilus sp.]|jgi:flagellar basal-body rod protein FlgC|nr:flagellar basal body rod protein FlgC [Terracidiphilus sp.]
MNLFGLMETSGSAMQAERMRAEVVAANMANAETTRTESGGPYHRQHVVFAANPGEASFAGVLNQAAGGLAANGGFSAGSALPGNLLPLGSSSAQGPAGGVHIAGVVEDPAPPLKRYDPGHPDAGPDGYVSYPDINPLTEMVDLMGATRAYGLNGSAVQAEKGMISSALEIAKS